MRWIASRCSKDVMKPHIRIDDTGEIHIEWIHPLLRFGISLAQNKVGWFCVSKSFEIMESGEFDLPKADTIDTDLPADSSSKDWLVPG